MNCFTNRNRGIILDFDGTLVQTNAASKFSLNSAKDYLVEKYNILPATANLIVNEFVTLVNKSEKAIVYESDEDLWRKQIWQKVLIDNKAANVEIDTFYSYYKESFLELIEIKKEVKKMLKNLQNSFKIIILTNGNSQWQRKKLEKSEANKYVDDIIISGEHKISKPDPRLFQLACLKLGLESKQCIMVGNNKKADIFGGFNAGLKATIWIRDKEYDNDSIQPDYIIDDICELESVLVKIF
ncbi:N-acylneuraminate-9-phosphatase [Hydra vulgaris]|nr:N-acylneuraminate-9-phosphatase [Hydra vulgaris]